MTRKHCKTIHVAAYRPYRRRRAAFSLAEVVMSVLVVALMLSAAIRTVAASRVAQYRLADRSRGELLADDLMAEILLQTYQDPVNPVFGPEPGELTRAQFNDVDDYNGYSEYPPKNNDGTTISGLNGWARRVDVAWVSATDPTATAALETGVKRITVTVTHSGMTVGRRVAVRTNAP